MPTAPNTDTETAAKLAAVELEARRRADAGLPFADLEAEAAALRFTRTADGYQLGRIDITDNGGGFGPAKDSGRWALLLDGRWLRNLDTLAEAKAAGVAELAAAAGKCPTCGYPLHGANSWCMAATEEPRFAGEREALGEAAARELYRPDGV